MGADSLLNPAIVERHELLSFQRPDRISDAVRLVAVVPGGLWPAVAEKGSFGDAAEVKTRLNLIVDRRNAIVHEDDKDTQGNRKPIDKPLVVEALETLETVVAALDELLDEYP